MPDAIYTGVSESHLGSLPPYGITVPSGAATTTAFTPTSISGLSAWYDFSDISTLFTDSARSTPVAANSDPIGGVTDKSGTGSHLGIATAGLRPLYKTGIYGSKSAALFDGVDDELHTTGSVSTVPSGTDLPVTVIAVLTPNWTSGSLVWAAWGSSAGGNPFYQLDDTATRAIRFQHRDDAASSASDLDAGTTLSNAAHVATLVYTGTAATLRVDGTAIASPAQPVTVDVGVTTLNQFSVGSLWRNAATGASFWKDYIGALVVYNSALSTPNTQLVERYFGTAFGITVA